MVMVGSHFWRGRNGRNKCSERTRTRCTDHADCCAVTACTYCLELEIYGEDIQYGVADQSDSHWTGTVGGYSFDMFWDRDYETEECVLIVEFDGEEVYRKSCYEGQSCRDSSDEVTVMVGYDEATLRWIKHEPLPLPHISDPDTGCKTWFCGECECSCECLCVTITEPDGTVLTGEICSGAYECDGPVWEGTIGYYELSLELGRGMYGECVLTGTVNGDEQEPVEVTGCKDMSATITLYDGTTISVVCKVCACEEPDGCPCCPGWPLGSSGSIAWTSSNVAPNDCDPISPGIVEVTGDFGCPAEVDNDTIIRTSSDTLHVRVYCDLETMQYVVQYKSAATSPGGVLSAPELWEWVTVTYDLTCPDCANAVDGIATGTIDFTAYMACETSGGLTSYPILVHGDIEVGC